MIDPNLFKLLFIVIPILTLILLIMYIIEKRD